MFEASDGMQWPCTPDRPAFDGLARSILHPWGRHCHVRVHMLCRSQSLACLLVDADLGSNDFGLGDTWAGIDDLTTIAAADGHKLQIVAALNFRGSPQLPRGSEPSASFELRVRHIDENGAPLDPS